MRYTFQCGPRRGPLTGRSYRPAMSRILARRELAPQIFEYLVAAPRIARKAQPGQFVIVMADQRGERIPLTIADFDRSAGTITLVMMVVGASTMKLSRLMPGESFYALIGPLGRPSELERFPSVVMVAGGVGAAPVFPIARAFRQLGSRVITIQGARSGHLLFWTDKLASVSDRHIVTTDDGSAGRPGLVTLPLAELLEQESSQRLGCVYAIGPAAMMKACCDLTRPYGVKTIVSLNTVMVDGTGMCGGCRVSLNGHTRFTCSDGPEFDGHLVDWDEFLGRQKTYVHEERCLLERYLAEWGQGPAESSR